MKKHLLPLILIASQAHGTILLNEVNLNPPTSDLNYEFIELKSTTDGVEACTGLTVLIINNDAVDAGPPAVPLNTGTVSEVMSLNELSTGGNGLLLLGNGYTGNPQGGPWAGAVDASTAMGDPAGLGDSDISSNDGLTILLVSGISPADLTTLKDKDLDVDNNGVFDWIQPALPPNAQVTTSPWTSIVDQIGTTDRGTDRNPTIATPPYVPNTASILPTWSASTLGSRDPDTFARRLGMTTPSAANEWYGGKLTGNTASSISYVTNRFFGPNSMLGEVTPGRPNLSATLAATSFRINEVNLNPSGDNDRFQYIEIVNVDGQARSLSGYWLVLIDSFDGSANPPEAIDGVGTIVEKWDLSDMATGPNGLLLIGNDFGPSYTPFADLVSNRTNFGDPVAHAATLTSPAASSFGNGDIVGKSGFTLVLMQNLNAAATDNLDIDSANGGTATTPLTALSPSVVDQVGFDQVGKLTRGRTYATAANLRTVMPAELVPDNFSRKPGDFSVGASAWYGGSFPDGAGSNVGYDLVKKLALLGGPPYDQWFGGFRGAGTPGLPNLTASITQTSPPVPATLRINEVMINPTNTEAADRDDNGEYIELRSTSDSIAYLDDLWILVINLDNSKGEIDASSPLAGYMTGPNGLVLIGDNYDGIGTSPYARTEYPPPNECAAFDPVSSFSGNNLNNNGVAILLIRGPKIGAGQAFTSPDGLKLVGDLDPDNDGVLLPPSDFCTALVDSIVMAGSDPGPGYAWIPSTPLRAHHLARYVNNTTASTPAAWYFGQVDQVPSTIPAVDYFSDNWVGNFKGSASPGRPNSTAPLGNTGLGQMLLNEVHLNPSGADNNFEFIELRDATGIERSLNTYYLVLMDNVVKNTGAIRRVWSLDGMKTGSNGLFTLGNRYPLGGINNPWAAVMRSQTAVGDPAGREGLLTSLSDGSIGDETDNQALTLLLVRKFNKNIGYDMDDKVGAGDPGALDSDGDGVFENYAWSNAAGGVHDSIQLRSYVGIAVPPVPLPAGYPWNGFPYSFADLSTTYLTPPARPFYHPESFARFQGNNSINNASAWYGGDLDPGSSPNDGRTTKYLTAAQDDTHPPFPSGFTGRVTPGQPNLMQSITGDQDNDGLANILELALGTNPAVPDAACPVVLGTTSYGSVSQATVSYPRIKGGAMNGNSYEAEAYVYTIETSTALALPGGWTAAANLLPMGAAVPDANGVTETVTYRINSDIAAGAGREFARLRVSLR